MEKASQLEVTDYHFKDLKGVPVNESTTDYEFQDIDKISPEQAEKLENLIKIERDHATRTNFKVAPIVREHRGMIRQEEAERETQIQNEVSRRLLSIEEEAYRKGFERGQEDGREEVYRETQAATDEKLQALSEMISEVLKVKAEMLKEQKQQVYEAVKTLTKWITLRELKEDGEYIDRLLEKLILEMQTKSNLLIHVNQSSFEYMPEVLEQIQKRIGELTNVRIEMDHGPDLPGLVLQSDYGILNGTLPMQFKNLDKLFSNVGLPFSDEPTLNTAHYDPEVVAEEAPVTEPESEEVEIVEATSVEEFEEIQKAEGNEETLDDFSFDDIDTNKDNDDEEK